jgi:hypothetical protein
VVDTLTLIRETPDCTISSFNLETLTESGELRLSLRMLLVSRRGGMTRKDNFYREEAEIEL